MPHIRGVMIAASLECHTPVWSRAPATRTIALSITTGGRRPMYGLMGRTHAGLTGARAALARQVGQGTVEYVALILLVALIMAGVVAAMSGFRTDEGKEIGDVLIDKIKQAIRKVQF
jgi:hypothetical protein